MKYMLRDVVVELTQVCNSNCIHCGSDCKIETLDNELSIEDWQSCIDQLASLSIDKVVFSGGEPTIKPEIEELIEYVGQKEVKFGIISNGWKMKKSLLYALVEAKPFAIGISLDGLKQTHNFIRNNDQSWTRALKTISDLMEAGISVCVVTTVNQLNCQELTKLGQFIDLAEIDIWQLQLAKPTGRMKSQSQYLINEQMFKQVCLDIIKMRKQYPHIQIEAADCFGVAPKNILRNIDWFGCSAGISSLGIDAFGNIMPCLALRSDLRCGNIRNQNITDIWQTSDKFDFNRNFSINGNKGNCKDCDYLERCGGGCTSLSVAYYGHPHSTPFCFLRSFDNNQDYKGLEV